MSIDGVRDARIPFICNESDVETILSRKRAVGRFRGMEEAGLAVDTYRSHREDLLAAEEGAYEAAKLIEVGCMSKGGHSSLRQGGDTNPYGDHTHATGSRSQSDHQVVGQ